MKVMTLLALAMAMVMVCPRPPLSHDYCEMKEMFKCCIENKALAKMKAHIVAFVSFIFQSGLCR